MKEENRRFIGNKGHVVVVVVVVYDSFGVLLSCCDFMTSRTTTIQAIAFAILGFCNGRRRIDKNRTSSGKFDLRIGMINT